MTHGFRGPTHGGEEVRLRVELAAPLPLVRGRLVDTGGRPLAARSVRAELWSLRHHSRDVQRRRTDEEGHFSGFGGAGLVGLGGHSILFALDDDERAVALRELPFPVPEGVIDLGDVMLELTDVATDQRVVLGHGPRARLVLANGLPQLPPAWSLRARVLGTDERESTATFDARGEAMLTLGETGSMPVTLWLERRADEGLHAVNGLPWSIDVADSTAEQSFTSPPFTREFLDHLERQTR